MDAILENNNAFQNLLARIAAGDTAAYDLLFRKYYASMVLYTDNILKNKSESEDLVSDLFCTWYNKRAKLAEVKFEKS